MKASPLIDTDRVNKLMTRIAHKVQTTTDMILPYADFTEFLTDLLRVADSGHSRMIVGGLPSPETALAADRAGLTITEIKSVSHFVGGAEAIAQELTTGQDILYLANPNRVTGANFGLADIEMLVQKIPEGLLILDEHYCDFYGISGVNLCHKYKNIIALRSLTGSFGIGSDQSGFAVTTPEWIAKLKQFHDWEKISFTLYKILITTMSNSEVLSVRLKSIHDESLRIATKLGKLKMQTRLSAPDFLLIRVANPKQVTKFLASYKIDAISLDQYSGLENYIKYRVQSPLSNDNFLNACTRMPVAYHKLEQPERRALSLRHGPESTKSEQLPAVNRQPVDTTKVVKRDHIMLLQED